jgi:hypothetical protein
MNKQYEKTLEMIKRHLGINTPSWIIEKVVNLLCEFYAHKDQELEVGNIKIEELERKVDRYELFIKNGVEFGKIEVPDTIDPAYDTIQSVINPK